MRMPTAPKAARKKTPSTSSRPSARARRAVAQRLVPDAEVLALDGVGVLALGAGGEDAGERAERRADHGLLSCVPITSTGSEGREQRDRAGIGHLVGRAELVGRKRQKAQPVEVQVGQVAQPVGAVEIGPFGAQDRSASRSSADLGG
jgi:hypothetical protein